MVARNEHTGDKIQTKETTKEYRDGWDAIFGKAGYDKPCVGCRRREIPCSCNNTKEKDSYKP